MSGSASIGLTVSLSVGDPSIATHMWIHWLEIAVTRRRAVHEARQRSVRLASGSDELGKEMRAELHASMVGVSAAAHAIDGLYGELKPLVPRPPPHRDDWSRHTHIFETLKRGCKLGPKTNSWPPKFKRLYGLRDQVVHHELTHRQSVPHPNGLPNLNVSQEMADYCLENVEMGVDLALDVAITAIESPRLPTVCAWASKNTGVRSQLRALRPGE